MKLKQGTIGLILVALLLCNWGVDSACSTEVVYPLMYGPGTWDLFINDIVSFSAGDILIGGKSYSTKTAGEGFVVRIDKYGKISWQKIYQSTATGEDSVDKVGVSNDLSFAIGHSTTGSANTYFLLKFASDGTVQYNAKIGSDTTKVGPDSILTSLILTSDATAQVYYDGNVSGYHRILGSYIVMDGSTSETLFGLKDYTNAALIRGCFVSTTAQTIFAIYNGKLFVLYYDTANASNTAARYATNNVSTLSISTGKSDMDLKSDSSEGWIAVISSEPYIYGFHTTVAVLTSINMDIAFRLGAFASTPIYVNILYVDSTHCIILTYLTDNSGLILKVDQSTAGSPSVTTKKISSMTNGKFVGYKLSTGFLLSSSIIGGESASYTKSQGIIFKSADDLTFATYNCYEVSTTVTLQIQQYTYDRYDFQLIPDIAGLTPYIYPSTTISYTAGTSSYLTTSTGIEIRAQSIMDNAAGTAKCKLQPVTLSYSAATYAVTSTASDVSLLSASQCQSALLTYTATLSGASSLPSWIQNTPSTPILNIRPSQVTSSTYLKANTVSVTVSDKNAVAQTATASIAATFTNSAPVVANTISTKTMYKGMGLNTITIPTNTFTDDDSITMSVSNNLSGTTPTTFSLSGTTLSVKMPNTYTGSFTTTVTDTDYVGQTISTTFTISVVNCTQNFCDYCTGTGSTQCTSCLDCYVLSSGACSYDKTSCANYTAPTYLTREVTATSPAGVGAPVAAATVASVGASVATGSSPVVAGLGISQCQSIQALSMFNMNTPDNYVSYSQGYEVTKLNFKFVNGIGLQDSLLKGTRRNLSTGYKSLSNIGFSSGNFFVNYIYFFLVLLIMIIVHLIVSLMLLCFNKKDNQSKCKRCLSWTKRGFEFSWYLNLFFFASLFIFILSLNDMAGKDTSTGLNVFSFLLSIFFFIFMIILTIFPLFLLCRQQSKLATIHHNREELTGFFDKVTYNYIKGLRFNRVSRLYQFVFLFRRLILAILIIGASDKATQLVVFVICNVLFTIYMIIVRPFLHKTQNFIAAFNEIILLFCCFLMFSFFGTGSSMNTIGIVMIVLFSVNIIICFSVSFIFQIYLYCHNRKLVQVKEFVKDGQIVRYQTQKEVEEPSFSKAIVDPKEEPKEVPKDGPKLQNKSFYGNFNEEYKYDPETDQQRGMNRNSPAEKKRNNDSFHNLEML